MDLFKKKKNKKKKIRLIHFIYLLGQHFYLFLIDMY